MRVERRIVPVQRRAVRADDFPVAAHVEKDMGMIERRLGADAHELARADLDHCDARVIVKVRNDVLGHDFALECRFDVAPHHSGPSAHFLVIRLPRLFKSHRSGTPKNRKRCSIDSVAPTPRRAQIQTGAAMIRSHPRLAWLAAGLFALAALFCVPLGLEAQSLLETAEDPVAIADRGLARAFDDTVAVHEIQAALDAADADLAQSFVDLAADQGVALPQELKQRVAAAVEQANSASAAAGSFASGL